MRTWPAVAMACAFAVSAAALANGQPNATTDAPAVPADDLAITGRVGGPVAATVADGRRVYASVDLHLQTFDLTVPEAPRLVATAPLDQGRPVPLPGNLDPMVMDGDRHYGLVDWDRQPPVGQVAKLRLVVLTRASEAAPWTLTGSVDLPAYTLAHGPQPPLPDMVVEGHRVYLAGYQGDTSSVLTDLQRSSRARHVLLHVVVAPPPPPQIPRQQQR
jgi:hypothetical protein